MRTFEFSQKIVIATALLTLLASPMAFAKTSIEINQDRSIGTDAFEKAQSSAVSEPPSFSTEELTYDKGDRQLDSHFLQTEHQSSVKHDNAIAIDLTHEVGDGLHW